MINDLTDILNRDMLSPQDKPLVAILIGPDGPEELWTLGRDEAGTPDPAAERLGLEWVDRLHDLLIAPRNTHEIALSEACSR